MTQRLTRSKNVSRSRLEGQQILRLMIHQTYPDLNYETVGNGNQTKGKPNKKVTLPSQTSQDKNLLRSGRNVSFFSNPDENSVDLIAVAMTVTPNAS